MLKAILFFTLSSALAAQAQAGTPIACENEAILFIRLTESRGGCDVRQWREWPMPLESASSNLNETRPRSAAKLFNFALQE